jgi:hypothetical protein
VKGIFDKDIGPSVKLEGNAIPEGAQKDAKGLPTGWTFMKLGPVKIFKEGKEINGALTADNVKAILDFHQAKGGEKIPIDSAHMLAAVADALGLDEDQLVKVTGSKTLALGYCHLSADADGNLAVSDVEWAEPAGAGLMKQGVLKYCSPVIRGLDGKSPLRITSLAMTNNPGLAGMSAIAATGEGAVDAARIVLAEELGKAKGLLALSADASASVFHGAISGLLAIKDEATQLKKELAQLKLSADEAKRDELITQGLKDGKISNATLPYWKTRGSIELTEYLKVAAPIVNLGELPPSKQAASSIACDAETLKIYKAAGLSDKQIEELQAEQKGK